jgi:uncharacterized protein (TIGR02271 family)
MAANYEQVAIREGTEVYGADGEKLGKVHSLGQGYLVVEKGFFFPTDYYIPMSAVATYEGDAIYLSVTKDEALTSGWDVAPTGGAWGGDVTEAEVRTDVTPVAPGGQYTDAERISVPVHEEELVARTSEREAGEVIVSKGVVSEQQTLEVPVTEERVRVTRRSVDQEGVAGEGAFRDEAIAVPLRTEEVEVGKRVRVAEEIEVEKEAVQRTERVSDTVRREVVDVEDATGDVVTDAELRGTDATS